MTGKEFMKAIVNGETDIVQLLLDILNQANASYVSISISPVSEIEAASLGYVQK